MTAGVYKYIDLVGTSPTSVEDAVSKAIAEASTTVRSIYWFEIKQVRGRVEKGVVSEYQVELRLGFKLE